MLLSSFFLLTLFFSQTLKRLVAVSSGPDMCRILLPRQWLSDLKGGSSMAFALTFSRACLKDKNGWAGGYWVGGQAHVVEKAPPIVSPGPS